MYANLKNHFRGEGVRGWNVGCGRRFNCITNVWNTLTEGGRGKEADLSNSGNKWNE